MDNPTCQKLCKKSDVAKGAEEVCQKTLQQANVHTATANSQHCTSPKTVRPRKAVSDEDFHSPSPCESKDETARVRHSPQKAPFSICFCVEQIKHHIYIEGIARLNMVKREKR